MKVFSKISFVLTIVFLSSCEYLFKEDYDYFESDLLKKPSHFLKNVMIQNDTVFLDENFDIDCRIEIPGYRIKSMIFYLDDSPFLTRNDTDIVNLDILTYQQKKEFKVHVLFDLYKGILESNIKLKSNSFVVKVVENLGERFIKQECIDGRLKLSWPELDKDNTSKYIIEKYYGEALIQSRLSVDDPFYIDQYYVGEEMVYKIMTLSKNGNELKSWGLTKSEEKPKLMVEQNPVSGYTIRWTKNRYFNNFKDYTLILSNSFTGDKILKSNIQINDTIFEMPNALFGSEIRLYLVKNPVSFPDLLTERQKENYSDFLYSRFGIPSVRFDDMVLLDQEHFAFTQAGKIFKYNFVTQTKKDSIVDSDSFYEYVSSTPSGKYVYGYKRYENQSFCNFWKTDNFNHSPVIKLNTNYRLYYYSDNLTAIATIQNNINYKYSLIYVDIPTDKIISELEFSNSFSIQAFSPDGNYFIGRQSSGYIYKLTDKTNWIKVKEIPKVNYFDFCSFDPTNNGKFYLFYNSNFYVLSLTDFSVINSFPLNVSQIINVDYNSRLILAYYNTNVLIINLDTGEIIKNIASDTSQLFLSGYRTRLAGNTIYSEHGVKYVIN